MKRAHYTTEHPRHQLPIAVSARRTPHPSACATGRRDAPSPRRAPPTKSEVCPHEIWTRFTMPIGGYSPAALHRLPTSWGAKVCPFSGVCPHPSRNENMLRTKSHPWQHAIQDHGADEILSHYATVTATILKTTNPASYPSRKESINGILRGLSPQSSNPPFPTSTRSTCSTRLNYPIPQFPLPHSPPLHALHVLHG